MADADAQSAAPVASREKSNLQSRRFQPRPNVPPEARRAQLPPLRPRCRQSPPELDESTRDLSRPSDRDTTSHTAAEFVCRASRPKNKRRPHATPSTAASGPAAPKAV